MPIGQPSTHRQDHGTLFLCSVLVVAVLGVIQVYRPKEDSSPKPAPKAAIAVEHAESASLTIVRSYGQGRNVMEFTQTSSGSVRISVPNSWPVREVRGGALEDIPVDKETSGYKRYVLSARHTLSLWLTNSGAILLHHPNSAPLLLTITTVDLQNGQKATRTQMVKDKMVEL